MSDARSCTGTDLARRSPMAGGVASGAAAEHHRGAGRSRVGLTIRVSRGVAEGRTRLSAFDGALHAAGVSNFNLIRLSSVIPPGSTVRQVEGAEQLRGAHGDALYCVYAAGYASTPHAEAWAGVAWSTHRDRSGAGLFVEHEGLSEADVRHELDASLADLSTTRGGLFEPAGELLASIQCTQLPVCAVVVATYRVAGWDEL